MHLLTPKGRFNYQSLRESNIKKKRLERLMQSILFHTKFLPESVTFNERRWCVQNGIVEYPKCKVCLSNVTKFHCDSYHGYRPYCSQSCANKIGTSKRSHELCVQVGRKGAITRIKKGIPHRLTSDALKKAWSQDAREKRKKTFIKKYGVENPGVLGAYSSNAAYQYIREYLRENQISEDVCYFKWGGINNEEFFQCLSIQGKKWYVSYDLVVFKDKNSALNKDMNSIYLVLEYNGPWHYTKKQASEEPNEMATPYPNSKTKMETFLSDKMKVNHIKKFCDNVLIFWERTGKLQKTK